MHRSANRGLRFRVHFGWRDPRAPRIRRPEICRRLREQLEKQPGITTASYADYVPLSVSAGSWEDLEIEGYVPGKSENMKIYRNLVAPGYFSLMKIRLIEGRDFTLQDDKLHAPVMIVSREFVHKFVPSGAALGGTRSKMRFGRRTGMSTTK